MAFVSASTSQVGDATKKEFYDEIVDNTKINKDSILGNNAEGTGTAGHIHADGATGIKILWSNINKTISSIADLTTKLFTSLDFTGSNLTSIATKSHSVLDDVIYATSYLNGHMTFNHAKVVKNNRRQVATPTIAWGDWGGNWQTVEDAVYTQSYIWAKIFVKQNSIAFTDVNNNNPNNFWEGLISTTTSGNIILTLIGTGNTFTIEAKIESGYLKIKYVTNSSGTPDTAFWIFTEDVDDGLTVPLT